jgi:hypothetical protein
MINVEFRRAQTEHRDEDTFLVKVQLPAVPEAGELVNINGDPFRVIERSWAFGLVSGQCTHLLSKEFHELHNGLWCYVRVR